MWWLLLIPGLFALSLIFGAPYVPTHKSAIDQAIKLIGLKPGQLLLELGAGDGRVALAAAKQGLRVEGFEANPLFWLIAKVRTWRYRRLVRLRLADFKSAAWPKDAAAIYVFADKFIMNYLARRLGRWPRPIRLVSYGFALPGTEPAKQVGALWRYDLNP